MDAPLLELYVIDVGQGDGVRARPDPRATRQRQARAPLVEQRGRHAKRTLDRSAGDLNTASQKLLLSYQAETEFAVDVAKACHHGAEDVDISFVRAMSARARR